MPCQTLAQAMTASTRPGNEPPIARLPLELLRMIFIEYVRAAMIGVHGRLREQSLSVHVPTKSDLRPSTRTRLVPTAPARVCRSWTAPFLEELLRPPRKYTIRSCMPMPDIERRILILASSPAWCERESMMRVALVTEPYDGTLHARHRKELAHMWTGETDAEARMLAMTRAVERQPNLDKWAEVGIVLARVVRDTPCKMRPGPAWDEGARLRDMLTVEIDVRAMAHFPGVDMSAELPCCFRQMLKLKREKELWLWERIRTKQNPGQKPNFTFT